MTWSTKIRGSRRGMDARQLKPTKVGLAVERYIAAIPAISACYIIQAAHGGNVKVGRSENVQKRFREIQYHCPDPMRLLGLVTPASMEGGIHFAFADVRLHGEWFLPDHRLLAFAADNAWKPARYV